MRLIDADELKKAIETFDKFACLPDCKLEPVRNLEHPEMFEAYIHFKDIITVIDNAPTVEPFAEVHFETFREYERPHGKWVDGKCDYCGCPCKQDAKNFCGNCGADMRGEEE